jgi:hypothetical protein
MTEAVSYWLLLKVFASGCTALTGVEAVSNGVKAFREPARQERPAHPHRNYFSPGGAAGGNFLPGEGYGMPPPIPASPATRAFSPCSPPRFSAKAFSTT